MTTHSTLDNSEQGFTLIEIAVSVAILGVALVSLIGLHTRMIDTYINEQNRFQAALALQYVASMLETEADPPELGFASDALTAHLEELGFFDADSSEQRQMFSFEGWQFEQLVESIGLPVDREELSEDAIRKISLRTFWGPGEEQQFRLVYFVSREISIPSQLGQQGQPGQAGQPGQVGQPGGFTNRP